MTNEGAIEMLRKTVLCSRADDKSCHPPCDTCRLNVDYEERIDAINMAIKALEQAPKWIPVSERLPEVGQCVLCYLKGWHYLGKYRVCKYRDADKYVNHPYFDFNENGFPDVHAWMPLPEPWKGEQHDCMD